MNKIVLEHYPVSKLPEELRKGLSPNASVKVTVEEESTGTRVRARTDFLKQLEVVRSGLGHKVSMEEAVERIRGLRDEWND